jgi:hypothetical protein
LRSNEKEGAAPVPETGGPAALSLSGAVLFHAPNGVLLEARMLLFVSIAGCTGIILGCLAASLADMFPARRKLLKDCGGGLILGGVALLGFSLPLM